MAIAIALLGFHDLGHSVNPIFLFDRLYLQLSTYCPKMNKTSTFSFKVLIAIIWDLQPLWSSSLTKLDLLRFRCSSGHVLSKTKSVTPHFFYISDITNSSSFNGKMFRKKINVRKFSCERP